MPDYRDSLPADDEAVEALEHLRIQTGQDSRIVFAGRNDGRLNKARKSSHNPLQDAEIKNFRWHYVQHHFTSNLFMAGVGLNTVSELFGHSTTLRYAHSVPENMAAAVARIAYGKNSQPKVNSLNAGVDQCERRLPHPCTRQI